MIPMIPDSLFYSLRKMHVYVNALTQTESLRFEINQLCNTEKVCDLLVVFLLACYNYITNNQTSGKKFKRPNLLGFIFIVIEPPLAKQRTLVM